MGASHSPADDVVYDLVTIQYHALKAAEAQDKYLRDAEGHDEVAAFFTEVAEQDAQRALRAHELIASLVSAGGGRDALRAS
jgi:hypothetical protein